MTRGTLPRLLLALLGAVLAGQLLAASPAAAHAELVSSSPANGERLDAPPREVTLEFTESVGLVQGGLVLLDGAGSEVDTPEPSVAGATVTWPMPGGLPEGRYLVSWRVVSTDSHPITGAFSFGVGVAPDAVEGTSTEPALSWPVTTARFAGYVGYSLAAGTVALLLFCWPDGRSQRLPQQLLRAGLLLTAVAALAGMLAQGPYAAGEPMTRAFSPGLLEDARETGFGRWSQARIGACVVLVVLLWEVGSTVRRGGRWLAALGLLAVATTFTGTGHAASGPLTERAVDLVHLVAAGVWVGGLAVLAVASLQRHEPRPGLSVVAVFSPLALASVGALTVTGALNAVVRLDSWAQLWDSGYGRTLVVKLGVVGVVVGIAAVSRRLLRAGRGPWHTIRLEVGGAVVVVATTALLASTSPPPERAAAAAAEVTSSDVEMRLPDGSAVLHIDGAGAPGATVTVELLDAEGRPRHDTRSVRLRATLPARDLGPIPVPLTGGHDGWTGTFDAPLPGTWTFTLTVESTNRIAAVTSGEARLE